MSRSLSSRGPLHIGVGLLIVVVFLAILIGGISSSVVPANSASTTACVVSDKDRTRDSEGGSDMRIYTENCGTLTVKDNIFKGFFSSSDVYASIEVGKTYDFDATGFRFGLLSMFPKINAATEV